MDQETIKILKEFALALIERQHQFFIDETVDNSEHVPAIKRIAESAYQYLAAKGGSSDISTKVRKELITHARKLFIKEWMTQLEEDEEPPEEEEARKTFNQLLKKNND